MKPLVLDGSPCDRNHFRIAFIVALPLFLLCFCLTLCNSPLLAADSEGSKAIRRTSPEIGENSAEIGTGELYALVVGVSRYKHAKIPQLKVSDKDARDFADFLKTQRKLFKDVHVDLLENENATKQEVEKHLYYKMRRAGKDDTVILFLSGHGADDPNTPGEFVFLTYDADPEYLTVTAVQMSRQWFLQKLDSKRVLLVADACHAGGFSGQGVKSLAPSFQNVVQQFKESEGRIFLASSRPDELSREKPETGNSVFTYYLLKGLRGEAADKDGVVTLKDLYDYVYSKTKDETKGFQRPQMEGRLLGRFPIALARDVPSPTPAPDLASPTAAPHREVDAGGLGGFLVRFYKVPKETSTMPDFSAFRGMKTTTAEAINLDPSEALTEPNDMPKDVLGLGMRFSGTFKVDGEGIFHWKLRFKGSARLHVDDKTIIDGESLGKASSKSGFLHLGEGPHTMMVDSLDLTAGPVLQLLVTPPQGPERLFVIRDPLKGWKEPEKPYDVLWGQVFFFPEGDYPDAPDFSTRNPVGRIIAPQLNILKGEGIPGLPSRKDNIGIRYQGFFAVEGAGIFAFRLSGDQYAKLTIGDKTIAQVTAGQKNDPQWQIGWTFLQKGSYPITVDYFHTVGEPRLQLFVTEPEKATEEIFLPARTLKGYPGDQDKVNMIPAFVYFLVPGTQNIPNFNKMTPSGMFFTKSINYPVERGSREFPGVPKRTDWLGMRFYVKFSLSREEEGQYKFRIVARDAARLIIGKKQVVNIENKNKTSEATGIVQLQAGSHELFLDYLQADGPNGLQLFITPPGGREKTFAFQ